MGSTVKWAKFGNYSGPYIKGTIPYVLPANPTGFDVIVAAIAKPEGGDYDTFVAYDGTAVTYGLLQWTFTSGRLHKLLAATRNAMGQSPFWDKFGFDLNQLTRLMLSPNDNLLLNGKEVTDFFSLRDVCTPPGGACPKTGPNWEKAKQIALLFSKLGENPIAQKVQLNFFREELKQAIKAKRPQMDNRTIASFLYPNGWDESGPVIIPASEVEAGISGGAPNYLAASRALFWGMWQNAPTKAQFYLGKTLGFDLSTQKGLEKLAKLYAYTNFARWGVAKAKIADRPYQSRYQKVATAINEAMGRKIVPEYWR